MDWGHLRPASLQYVYPEGQSGIDSELARPEGGKEAGVAPHPTPSPTTGCAAWRRRPAESMPLHRPSPLRRMRLATCYPPSSLLPHPLLHPRLHHILHRLLHRLLHPLQGECVSSTASWASAVTPALAWPLLSAARGICRCPAPADSTALHRNSPAASPLAVATLPLPPRPYEDSQERADNLHDHSHDHSHHHYLHHHYSLLLCPPPHPPPPSSPS
jgi:hypothetical protein